MNEKRKYQAIIILGGLIVVFIVLLREVMPVKLNFFLIGAAVGWFSSVLLFHSLSDKEKKGKKKRRKSYDEVEETISLEKLKSRRF